ncbi:MAG: metal-dependent transcriptional regulator [Acetanaerobacterium sp.]
MVMQESGENYLETILVLHQRSGYVRSIDIASELGFTKPSISRAMSILRENGYITMDDKNGQILLTDKGREKAEKVYERHCMITRYLTEVLGVSPETADTDACRIEHIISQESFDRMKGYLKENCPAGHVKTNRGEP